MSLALIGISSYGVMAPANLLVPFITVFASFVFGRRTALRLFLIGIVALVIVSALYLSGVIDYQVEVTVYVHAWTSWIALVAIQVVLPLWYLFMAVPINEASLQISERLDAVLQGINDALFIHDKDTGAILQVNQKMNSHVQARRAGDAPKRPLADPLIGAFASRQKGLITRNPADFRRWFPKLKLRQP
jgi:predicted nucleic acid-binding protein